jgi:glycosyltransferase involved in cell wall biosynthesis
MSPTPRPWASVVIPIKDERDNLTPLTERVLKVLSAREESNTAPFELIYIDDGSSDGSSELLDRLQQTYPAVRVLHFDRNYGQSSAFDAGFKHSTGDLVITLDGDLQNDPADIDKMLPLLRQFDLVAHQPQRQSRQKAVLTHRQRRAQRRDRRPRARHRLLLENFPARRRG